MSAPTGKVFVPTLAEGMYVESWFTGGDKRKLETLTRNYHEGLEREQLAPEVRKKLDADCMKVTAEDVMAMRKAAGMSH